MRIIAGMQVSLCVGGVVALLFAFGCARPDATSRMDSLRSTIDTLVAANPGAIVAVSVRDGPEAFDRNAGRLFHAASTMKIAVMIEAFRRAASGKHLLNDSLVVRNAFRSIVDGSDYRIEDDSDDALYEHLGRKMAVHDLVYQMITVSSNLATNLLIDRFSADSVQATIERLGTKKMQVLRGVEDLKAFRQGLNNRTTAADLATLLDALLHGRAVSPEADRAMLDILLDQRFNTMIPAGLPADVRVAHKTGSITNIHHDAAIVYPANGEPYVLVILIEGIADDAESAVLGAGIARVVHAALRP